MSRRSRKDRRFTRGDGKGLIFALLAVGAGIALAWMSHRAGHPAHAAAPALAAVSAPSDTTWTVGELRPDGLRIVPSGRTDAAEVLDPDRFQRPEVREAYRIASAIPETLNQLYCWCGCENRGIHRSNLACFEDEMGVNCDVCRGTAEIAWEMTQRGETDPAAIQAAVDAKWAPPGTEGGMT